MSAICYFYTSPLIRSQLNLIHFCCQSAERCRGWCRDALAKSLDVTSVCRKPRWHRDAEGTWRKGWICWCPGWSELFQQNVFLRCHCTRQSVVNTRCSFCFHLKFPGIFHWFSLVSPHSHWKQSDPFLMYSVLIFWAFFFPSDYVVGQPYRMVHFQEFNSLNLFLVELFLVHQLSPY